MVRTGTMLREGFESLAAEAGVGIRQTGPVQMPNMAFEGDKEFARAKAFCATLAERGVIAHPRHNWFVSAAHTDSDVERILDAAREGFAAVRGKFGEE
jgi:glutamate-1-semialdehyde 2,1-aminomutase